MEHTVARPLLASQSNREKENNYGLMQNSKNQNGVSR